MGFLQWQIKEKTCLWSTVTVLKRCRDSSYKDIDHDTVRDEGGVKEAKEVNVVKDVKEVKRRVVDSHDSNFTLGSRPQGCRNLRHLSYRSVEHRHP